MSDDFPNSEPPLRPSVMARVDQVCDGFEAAWQRGERPRIEDFLLDSAGEQRAELLRQLLLLELDYCKRQSETPAADELLSRFPEHRSIVEAVFLQAPANSPVGDTADWSAASSVRSFSPPRAPTLDLPGRKIGRFEVQELLGRGGFGAVYRARDPQLDRDVALKVPRANVFENAADIDRFLREARVCAQLRHTNIVPVHDAGQVDGVCYIASQFVEGQTLRAVLEERKAFPPREAAQLVAKLAAALDYAHSKGIIHRDIKPDNVMIGTDGEPYIMDFGLARRHEGEALRTQEGDVMGTPAYMSPEQAQGQSHLADGRTDQWSLGVVLYELLTGQRPFTGTSPAATLLAIVCEEPATPRRHQPRLARDLETICVKALSKGREDRYESCQALANDLRRYLEDEPIRARRLGAFERSIRWCRKNRLVAALLAAVALSLLATAVATSVGYVKTANALAQAEKRRAEMCFNRAANLCEQGELALGMLWFGRCLETGGERAQSIHDAARFNLSYWYTKLPRLRQVQQGGSMIAFSSNRKTMLTAASGGEARLWDVATGEPLGPSWQHLTESSAAALSPNGDIALVAPHLWRATTGEFKVTLDRSALGHPPRYEDAVMSSGAFSPDGKTVIVGGLDTARLWDVGTGRPIGFPLSHPGNIRAVAFSPNGKMVLTGGDDKTARLWDVVTGKLICPALEHEQRVLAVVFSPGGDTILTGSSDKTARLWNAASGKPQGPAFQHQGAVTTVAFSPDGNMILTGTGVQTVHLWNAATFQAASLPLYQPGSPVAVGFSHDGKTIVTGAYHSTRRWELLTTEQSLQRFSHKENVDAVSFSPNGNAVLIGSNDHTARLWNADTGEPLGPPLEHRDRVTAVSFSPDAKLLVTQAGFDSQVWNAATGNAVGRRLVIYGPRDVILSPDNKTFITKSTDGSIMKYLKNRTISIWDTTTGNPLADPLKDAVSAAYSPDGKRLLTGSLDTTARVWDAHSGRPLEISLQHEGAVCAVAFSPDGKTMLTGSIDKTARLWHAATGQPIGPPLEHDDCVQEMAFSPDAKKVLTRSTKVAHLWNAETGRPVGPPLGHPAVIQRIAFSPDSKTVLTKSSDGVVHLWDAATGIRLASPLHHRNSSIFAVAFSSDSQMILTGSWDGTARLWHAATGQPIGPPFEHDSMVRAVQFRHDNNSFLTIAGSSVRIWEAKFPVEGSVEQIVAWLQVITGAALDENGMANYLSAGEWQKAQDRLMAVSGPPID